MSGETDWRRELTAYIDGELPEAERAQLEAKLREDPELRALEARLRQTVGLVRQLPAAAPSPALKAKVFERLDGEVAPAVFWSWQRVMPLLAVAAAALAVLVLRGVRPGDEPILAIVQDDQVLLAQNLDVVEDLDLVGLASPEDVDVIEQLEALEVTR